MRILLIVVGLAVAPLVLAAEEEDVSDLEAIDEEDFLTDEFALLQEEEIIYTAAKHEQAIVESPSAVTVITREQIENTHCTDLVCLLRQVPEVHVRKILPMFAAVGARALSGESGDKALLIIDGREENIEIFGAPFWMILPIHLEDIERIEVIRGPGSALYGANAHSMVVSIFTRKTDENFSRVFIGGGENDRLGLHARVGAVLGEHWRLQLSGGYETGGNWRLLDTRELTMGRIRLRMDREDGDSTTSLQAGLVIPEGGAYTSLAPTESFNAYLGHLIASHETGFLLTKLTFGLYGSDFHLDMPLFFGPVKLGEFPKTVDFFSSNLDGEVQINWEPFGGNLLIAGGNYRWITLVATKNRPETVHQHRVGVFLHDEQRLGENLVLTGGIRFDYNNITPFTVSPRLACVWRFTGDQFLRFAFGRAFRKPSFMNTSTHFTGVVGEPGFKLDEFFVNSVGNEGLDNESITAFEIGYRGRLMDGDLTVEADAFLHLYRDTISFNVDIVTGDMGLPDLDRSKMIYTNRGREVNSVGGSLSLTYRLKGFLWASANYTYRYTWYLSAPEEMAVVEGGQGDRVPWEPAHLANLALNYLPADGLRCGLSVHGASEHDLAMPENGGLFDDPVMVHSPPFIMVGGFVAWRVNFSSGWFEGGVRAFNVFHQGFRDTQAVSRPDGVELGGELIGRQIFLFMRGRI